MRYAIKVLQIQLNNRWLKVIGFKLQTESQDMRAYPSPAEIWFENHPQESLSL